MGQDRDQNSPLTPTPLTTPAPKSLQVSRLDVSPSHRPGRGARSSRPTLEKGSRLQAGGGGPVRGEARIWGQAKSC